MAVRKSQRRGKPCLVIDIRYTSKDGRPLRFRKDAQAQTMAAARAEDKRYLHNIAQYGSPYEPGAVEETPQSNSDLPKSEKANSGKLFVDVVDEFRQTFMVAKLKITTRKGYEAVLSSTLVPRFGELPIEQVNGRAAEDLDLELVKRRLKLSTRNNIQIVLRSVLRFAMARQYIPGMPDQLPSLKQTGQNVLEIPSDEHIVVLLAKARPSHRCSFTLMADAGLRPMKSAPSVAKTYCSDSITVNPLVGISPFAKVGPTAKHTPKTGQREVPISRDLARVLAPYMKGARDKHVALNESGKPWSQYGLDQAFGRLARRAGLGEWSVYGLHHCVITSWLHAGIPVHVVQRMAGHVHLSTTQRYVHFLKQDLEEAAQKIAARSRPAPS